MTSARDELDSRKDDIRAAFPVVVTAFADERDGLGHSIEAFRTTKSIVL